MKCNSTREYHLQTSVDLMSEYTICESFGHINTPYQQLLERPRAYGALLGDFLKKEGVLGRRIQELGGGYGTLMRGLLETYDIERVHMLDLSPSLLRRQRQTLAGWPVEFEQGDMLEYEPGDVDLIICNEVIGDLDTLVDVSAAEEIERYGLETPGTSFNFNLGAVRLVERLAGYDVPIFLSEHSSDPIIPEGFDYLAAGLELDSFAREVPLFKHSEYTIRFNHLVKVAEHHGRRIKTGSLFEIIPLEPRHEFRFVFTSRACSTERQEIIFELLDHLREYRYLLIY